MTEELHSYLIKNPAYMQRALEMLRFCETTRTSDELVGYFEKQAKKATVFQDPLTTASTLGRLGGLRRVTKLNGIPYVGTQEELEAEQSTGGDEEVLYEYQSTKDGLEEAANFEPVAATRRLLKDQPQYGEGFLMVLKTCEKAEGCSRDQIAEALSKAQALPLDERTHLPIVYPSYFTGALEHTGALEWNGVWHATYAGKEVIRKEISI